MKVSVIIVNYNVRYFLELCLHSVGRALEGLQGEIIVADNNSSDDSVSMVRKQFPEVILIENKDNKGFSKANNQGVAIARGEYILFLNPDTVVPEDFFGELIGYMDQHPEAGTIGPRIIDGKGVFSPDGKKSFPTLPVALFKTTGINKLFPESPYFNRYYAVHIGEDELAETEVLSGCCMMVRRSVIEETGAFDEDFFMYCEDVDLCYRINKAGYTNIYFPHTTIIHYKGESTRKSSLSYVRTFNEALSIFVRKHYSAGSARLFIFFINAGIVVRAVLSVLKKLLKVLRMPLFDTIVLLVTFWFIKEFWTGEVKNISPIPLRSIYFTLPAYLFIWIGSMFLNGAYDQPYRGLRVVRGMLTGTVLCLAYFGLIAPELRYSRAIIIITGASGAVLLVALHELLHRMGIFRFTPYNLLPGKAVIVAEEAAFQRTAATLKQVHYAPEIYGRISTHHLVDESKALANIDHIGSLLYTAGIDEVIFCVNGLSYREILKQMQHCGGEYEYKIHLPGSHSFVGSNSSHTSGDLYIADKRFSIAGFAQQRNKRVMDISISFFLILFFPVTAFLARQPLGLVRNCLLVLAGLRTWVSYDKAPQEQGYLPPLKRGILPPYYILKRFEPSKEVKAQMNIAYAENYSPYLDTGFILKNLKYSGRKV